MKKIINAVLALAAAFAAFSCVSEEGEEVSWGNKDLKIVSSELSFAPAGGENKIIVETSGTVTAETSVSWLTLSVEGKEITLTAALNPSVSIRYAKIVISSGKESATVTAQQNGVILKDFNPSDIAATNKGGRYEFTYTSNLPLTVSADKDFVTATADDEEGVLTIVVNPNATIDYRTAVVTYSAGNNTGKINIGQAGSILETSNWSISYDGRAKGSNNFLQDSFTVTVTDPAATGSYQVVAIPKATYTASGEEQEDFVVSTATPALLAELGTITASSLYSTTATKNYFPKLNNGTYLIYAIGLDTQGHNSGYYAVKEVEINYNYSGFAKYLGNWNYSDGTVWAITTYMDGEAYYIDGIQGFSAATYGDDWGLNTVGNMTVIGYYDSVSDTWTLTRQNIANWVDGAASAVLGVNVTVTDFIAGTNGSATPGATRATALNGLIFTASMSGSSMVLTPASGVGNVQYFMALSGGYGNYDYCYMFDYEVLPVALPATLTK